MATWQDEPGAREWRQAVDAADSVHGPGVPPGYLQGCAAIDEVARPHRARGADRGPLGHAARTAGDATVWA